jgi:hypothetical protein
VPELVLVLLLLGLAVVPKLVLVLLLIILERVSVLLLVMLERVSVLLLVMLECVLVLLLLGLAVLLELDGTILQLSLLPGLMFCICSLFFTWGDPVNVRSCCVRILFVWITGSG